MMSSLLGNCLRAGNQIRVHENGFLYIDLPHGANGRLHLWGKAIPWNEWLASPTSDILNDLLIPRQRVFTPIHDHVFDMTSFVLGGEMIDERWEYASYHPSLSVNAYEVYVAENDGLRPKTDATLVWPRIAQQMHLVSGQMYHVPSGQLHCSTPVISAMTLMLRGERMTGRRARPRVLVPQGRKPDNVFRRDQFDHIILVALARRIVDSVL